MAMPQWLVIGISGVTCGGKSILANNLREYFQKNQNLLVWNTSYSIGDVQVINQDDYFLPVDDLRHKWIDKLNAINFELLTSLDMKQMISDITWTMKGRYLAADPIENVDYMNEISMSISFDHYSPHHNPHQQIHNQQSHRQLHNNPNRHQTHSNSTHHLQNSFSRHNTQHLETNLNILIIEGFIIFNQPELLKICHLKFHFHLPYEKCYARRQQRTYDPPDVIGYFEMCVWPMYEKNYSEFRHCKDITVLNGEISQDKIFKFVLNQISHHLGKLGLNCIPLKTIGVLADDSRNGSCPMDHQ